MPETPVDVLSKLVHLLEPLDPEARLRTVRAALLFLGSEADAPGPRPAVGGASLAPGGPAGRLLPQKAERWARQNGVDVASLEACFHFRETDVQIIVTDVPGRGQKEKAGNCYLLAGVKALMEDGEPLVDDDTARELCKAVGCYDSTNHAKYVKALGNAVTSTKGAKLELTQPGLKQAADLVKTIGRGG